MQNRLRYQRLGLVFALALPAGLAAAGCAHSTVPTKDSEVAAGDACNRCTLAQRICLIAGDLPGTIGQSDFVPAATYTARWQSHVKVWRAQLAEIAKDPALDSYAQSARKKLDQADASEHDRRLIVENGDLLYALKVLGQKAKTAEPAIELGCPLPE